MLFFKSMKKNKFSFISFNAINLFLNLLIFGIVFFFCSQIVPMIELSGSLKDENVYVIGKVDEIEDDYSEEDNSVRAEYYYDYVEIDGGYKEILYVNEKAFDEGLPYDQDEVMIFYFNKLSLEKNKIYTNNQKNVSENVTYSAYFTTYRLNNVFVNMEVDCPYLCIVDDIENPDYVIYDFISEKITKHVGVYNERDDQGVIGSGEYLRNETNEVRSLQMRLFVAVSIIPLFFSSLVLIQFYQFFIEQRKDDILINYIYYKKKRSILNNIFVPLFLITSGTGIAAILLMYFILLRSYIMILLLAVIIALVFNYLTIHMTTKKEIKRIMNTDAWRDYND